MAHIFKVGTGSIEANRIFCIGKNYEEHIRELASDFGGAAGQPVVFMKPASSLVPEGKPIILPRHGKMLHHEVEVVVLIGKQGRDIPESEALDYVAGVTLGLDLTLRDVQAGLKKKGHPWELAKAFDHSAPIGNMIPYDGSLDLSSLQFRCEVNAELRQEGNTKDMIYSVPSLVHFLSTVWTLLPGDLIYTGTPAGVGELRSGDSVVLSCILLGKWTWKTHPE